MTSQLKTMLLLATLSAIIIVFGGAMGGRSGLMIAFCIAVVMNVGSYWFSDKIVLSMYKARELSRADAPMIHEMVEQLAANAGIPKPRICVVPEEAPNAFATGRNPQNAVVAVTQGLLRLLSPEELRGVLAHEISHIAHRDILVQSVASVLASVIVMLANMAQFAAIFGGGRSEGRGGNPVGMLLMAILGPVAATLIQMAISRSREYYADSGGAQYSGDPAALASALAKLQSYNQKVPMQRPVESTENMFIVSPLLSGGMKSLFSTHPPTEERIRRLMEMSRR